MWEIAGNSAILNTPTLSARLDLERPERGLEAPRFEGKPFEGVRLLQIALRRDTEVEQVTESYARGTDLVVTYAESPSRPIRPQVYWRILSEHVRAVIEVIVSTQTSLLDADSSLVVSSDLPSGELLQCSPGVREQFRPLSLSEETAATAREPVYFLFRPAGATWSYAEIVYPTDFSRCSVSRTSNGAIRLSNSLFAEHLEKGVIRRGRIRGLFLKRDGDEASARAGFKAFLDSPLPLTT